MGKFLGLETKYYPYYDRETQSLDFAGMMNALDMAPKNSLIILHPIAHNPSGTDPSHDQWNKIMKVCLKRKLVPFFDMAYQGMVTGDVEEDAWAVRMFANNNVPMFVGTSFSKNMGLYGQRTGTLSILCDGPKASHCVQSQLDKIARNTWSTCPAHGAIIADTILRDEEIRGIWEQDLITMTNRISDLRTLFVKKLTLAGSPHNWSHIIRQNGMFAYTGIGASNVKDLIDEHHVYLTNDGRMSVSSLNDKNIDYVVNAFHKVTKDGFDWRN